MNAPLEPAHSKFGGSVATRILHCRASVGLVEKVPMHLRKTSVYAARGSSLHVAMALLIENECSLDDLAGRTIGDYTLTSDDVEDALRPTFAYVNALLDAPDAAFYIEKRVTFPSVPGAYGTCDLVIRTGNVIDVVDYKFGSGVRVLALHADGDEDVVNGQLLYYAAAARHSLPEFFARVDAINLTILQPMSIEIDAQLVSIVQVTGAELDEFVALFREACAEALSPSPRLERGHWCRFCPARPICPAHTGPLLDLAQFELPTPSAPDYLPLLAAGLNLVEAVKDIGRALHDQAKAALHAGDSVPGFTLSAGRAVRSWRDEAAVAPALLRLGLARDDVLFETLRSPRQIEARAKARAVKIPNELIVSQRSGVSLVRSENAHDPIPGRAETMRDFVRALDAFQKGKAND
jgi:Protein of unknown function (DUF2800)